MKNLLSLCLILLFVTTNSAAQTTSDQVIDADEDPVEVGSDYFIIILPEGGDIAGGLKLSNYPNLNCSATVSCDIDEDSQMCMPFRLSTPNSPIRVSQPINILSASDNPPCVTSNMWRVDYDESTQSRLIRLGGKEGDLGCDTSDNWFKLEQGSEDVFYKIVWSPKDVCNTTTLGTHHVSVRVASEEMPLIAVSEGGGESGMEVFFVKNDSNSFKGHKKYYMNMFSKGHTKYMST